MKKAVCALLVSVFSAVSASAYFDGGVGITRGPGGYTGTDLNIEIGNDRFFVKPGLSAYTSDAMDKTYKVYRVRGGMERDRYTAAAETGFSAKEAGYSYNYFGADVTVSLTQGGGKGRLAGPSARSAGGGSGITRIDAGVGVKRHTYSYDANNLSQETGQNEFSVFAGAKVMMAQVSAAFTGYSYGADKAPMLFNRPAGLVFVSGGQPRSSVNVRAELPSTFPMIKPFAGYTTVKYKGADSESALQLGGTVNLGMVTGVVSWQSFDGENYLSASGGLNFSF